MLSTEECRWWLIQLVSWSQLQVTRLKISNLKYLKKRVKRMLDFVSSIAVLLQANSTRFSNLVAFSLFQAWRSCLWRTWFRHHHHHCRCTASRFKKKLQADSDVKIFVMTLIPIGDLPWPLTIGFFFWTRIAMHRGTDFTPKILIHA